VGTLLTNRVDRVGPILQPGTATNAVIAAIRALNPDVEVTDRGGYLRVSAAGRCVVSRLAIEAQLGRAFALPGDLEQLMPSFQGKLVISDEQVEWLPQQRERASPVTAAKAR
jgi:hypothetical protein